jgi:class 3 adenylate cyclase
LIGPDLIFENTNGETEGKDIWVAPDGKDILGVMIEATAFSNFIHREYISRIPDYGENIITMVSLFLIILILLASPPNYATSIATLTTIVSGSVAHTLFLHLVFLPVVIFNIVIWLFAIARSFQLYVWEQNRKALLAQQFGYYLDPAIVKEIVTSGEAPDLGGRMIGCALMFTDIVGFTTYSESLSPIEVGDSLNQYFTRIQGQIFSQKGTFLSMLGDGLFALWGAPIAVIQECDHALSAARGIHDGEVNSLNLQTRIGLHYGEVLVGHFGSRERYDYSAIGEEVNLTSRIEGLNKLFGTRLLMSKTFVTRLSNIDSILYLGKVQVAGVSRPVAVYTLDQYGMRPLWEDAVRHFEQSEFQLALELFDSVNVLHPFSTNLTSPYIRAILKGTGEPYLVVHTK